MKTILFSLLVTFVVLPNLSHAIPNKPAAPAAPARDESIFSQAKPHLHKFAAAVASEKSSVKKTISAQKATAPKAN